MVCIEGIFEIRQKTSYLYIVKYDLYELGFYEI